MHRKRPIVLSKPIAPILLSVLFLFSACSSREERITRAISKADEARQRDETSNALTILGKSSLKNPDRPALQEALGNTYLEANDPLSAIESFEKAIQLDPNRQRLWVTVADLYERLGEYPKAKEALASYLQSFPDDFLAWKNLASIHKAQGELNEAIQASQPQSHEITLVLTSSSCMSDLSSCHACWSCILPTSQKTSMMHFLDCLPLRLV